MDKTAFTTEGDTGIGSAGISISNEPNGYIAWSISDR